MLKFLAIETDLSSKSFNPFTARPTVNLLKNPANCPADFADDFNLVSPLAILSLKVWDAFSNSGKNFLSIGISDTKSDIPLKGLILSISAEASAISL